MNSESGYFPIILARKWDLMNGPLASINYLEIRDKSNQTRPFLKWAGGKSRLSSKIGSLIPARFGKYIEPFLGGGALFFATCYQNAVLADSNRELMNCYEVVRDRPLDLIKSLDNLSKLEFSSETFYKIRSWNVSTDAKVDSAARMIYLNRTAYNGLYRVNRKGGFNTPFGSYKALSLPSSELLLEASRVLRDTSLEIGDFEKVLDEFASPGDFVYLDPPYPPVGKYSDFNRYTKDFFDERDHQRLSHCIKKLDEIGCSFVLSNADHPLIRELYDNGKFKILKILSPRYINCKGNGRGKIGELLVTNCNHAS